jgi:adenosylcobinamide-phosphate synthase
MDSLSLSNSTLDLLLKPSWIGLLGLFAIDLIFGDPRSLPHPIVIIGKHLRWVEDRLFQRGYNGRWGGVSLCVWLLMVCNGLAFITVSLCQRLSSSLALGVVILFTGWLLAFRSLQEHGRNVRLAIENEDLEQARLNTSYLVGRDTTVMDYSACGRATIESLSENLVDGILAPLFWYILFGMVGMLSFKIVSTMDSMVGYKNERYFYFGWAGARLDDVMNYIPARLSYILIIIIAFLHPKFSGIKAFQVGLRQHALLPSPNSGWSEAATAGALQIKLVGPIVQAGKLVTTIWIGNPQDPEGGQPHHLRAAGQLITWCTLLTLTLGLVWMAI